MKKQPLINSRIRRFASLSFANKMLAIETVLTLLLAWLITRFIPARYWLRYLHTEDASTCDTQSTTTESLAANLPRRIGQVVSRVAHHLPFNARCLAQAMAAQWMLRRRGVCSVLVFGVRRNTNLTHVFEYHAWLMVGGEAIIGSHEVDCYKAFPTSSAS